MSYEEDEEQVLIWMKEFGVEREAAQCAVRASRVMEPEEFDDIFSFFLRRIVQERRDALTLPVEHRWYCAPRQQTMFQFWDRILQQDDYIKHKEQFIQMKVAKDLIREEEAQEKQKWSLDRRLCLVPVMNALEPSEVIDAKPDSLEWRFLYCARKEGVVAMRTFLQNGHIREEDTKYIRDLRGRSALHFAATTGNVEMIPFFTHLVNAFDRDGYTPLHIAVWFGYTDFVEALIKENADANITSRDEAKYGLNLLRFHGRIWCGATTP